jgi:F-type H+-transporting ATPase subunit alpha
MVSSVADGIIQLVGLRNVSNGEQIYFFLGHKIIPGLILNLSRNNVSAVIFENSNELQPGIYAARSTQLLSLPVTTKLLGRVIDPLGRTLDLGLAIESTERRAVEIRAPSILARTSVRKPLETGIKVIDSLVPIGHGQRELIIGDTKTGKTSIGIDTILHQKGKGTICIYVAIGQKLSEVARIAKLLNSKGALDYSVIVAATSATPAAAQYIAPYSGCSIGEYFMHGGNNVVVVYDDLSKHAVSYRQLSLLLRRPPGREGYPGDVFYLHSRLLERAANLLSQGSLTALPIIETIQGDVSAYIPTNVISITDGQIFLETELFAKGIRPAVSPGLSVSRVGSAAQNKTMKKLAGNLKLELAQFREVEDFTKLGFALDEATSRLVNRGQKFTRLLVQPRSSTIEICDQLILLYSAMAGLLDNVPVDLASLYEIELYNYLHASPFYIVLSLHILDNFEPSLFEFFLNDFTRYFISKYSNKTL